MGCADDEDTFLGKASWLEATTRKVEELHLATTSAQFEDTIFYYHSVLVFGEGQNASRLHLFAIYREEGIGTTCIVRVDAAIPIKDYILSALGILVDLLESKT
jgi:hypothetical protein